MRERDLVFLLTGDLVGFVMIKVGVDVVEEREEERLEVRGAATFAVCWTLDSDFLLDPSPARRSGDDGVLL